MEWRSSIQIPWAVFSHKAAIRHEKIHRRCRNYSHILHLGLSFCDSKFVVYFWQLFFIWLFQVVSEQKYSVDSQNYSVVVEKFFLLEYGLAIDKGIISCSLRKRLNKIFIIFSDNFSMIFLNTQSTKHNFGIVLQPFPIFFVIFISDE